MKRAILAPAALLSLLSVIACHQGTTPTTTTKPDLPRAALTVALVDYDPNKIDLGKIAAVADLAESVMVFGDKGMSVLVAGAVTATDGSVTSWSSAGVIPAADGTGSLVVGIDAAGDVQAVDPQLALHDVSSLYWLAGEKVHAVAPLGGALVAFLLDEQIAIADGANVTHFDLALTSFAGSKGRVAGISSGEVHVFDAGTHQDSAYAAPGAAFVTFDGDGKVVAATPHELLGEDDTGALTRLADLSSTTVHGLATSPAGVWIAMGSELGLLANGTLAVSSGAGLPADATLIGSSSGDVWALSAGALSRYSVSKGGDESLWDQTVLPIFTRVCSQCHLPGGSSGIDLSSYSAWAQRRAKIGLRVIDHMPTPMPPASANAQLSSDDLAAIKAWVDGTVKKDLCGNGVIDPGEDCDGLALGASTCVSLGHTGGQLTCDASCKLQQSACVDAPTDWYDLAWKHRRAVTLQHGQVAGDLTDFPVALIVSDPGVLGGLQASGADVLFTTADGKTKLSHEIERFDVASSQLVIWVRVPALSASVDTPLYLYYGNATCASQESAALVWDASDQTVWHLGEAAMASKTGAVHHDATGHGHDGAQQGNGSVAGKIGQGQSFDGVGNYIDVGSPAGVVIGGADCTVSAWIKTSAAVGGGIVTRDQAGANAANSKVIGMAPTSKLGFQNGANAAYGQTGQVINDGNWHHVAWTQTAAGPAWDFYVDGVHDHVSPVVLTPDAAGLTLRLGSRATGSAYAPAFFSGVLDEVRISSTPRSAVWLLTSFQNQSNPASFATLGPEEAGAP